MLHGPLIMLPSAEDNYGTESCSIRVMKSSPSVIVIATATGKLYHCIALWSNNFDEDHDAGDFDAQVVTQTATRTIISFTIVNHL